MMRCFPILFLSLISFSANSIPSPLPTPENKTLLNQAAETFHEITKNAMPAVVSVSAIKSNDSQPPLVGIGSGIIVRPEGYVLTNHHVVEKASRITVSIDGKNRFPAKLVGTDSNTDLAVLKIEKASKNLRTLKFADSDLIKVGDWALAIGSPFGLTRSVSFGVISAKGRAQMGILDVEDFIQTDAAINPGSSGGPLLNSSGEIIGVNTAIFSQNGGFMGIGFAIPSRIAREITDEIIAHGRVRRGWLGVTAQDLDSDLAKYFNATSERGALISDVAPGGPASQANMKPGDIVTEYDDQPIDNAGTFKSRVGKTPGGLRIKIQIFREGKPKQILITVREQTPPAPIEPTQLAGRAAISNPTETGLIVEDLPEEISNYLKIPIRTGVWVAHVKAGSPAFDSGILPGDVILKANQREIRNTKEFNQFEKRNNLKTTRIVLYIQRGENEKLFIPLRSE